MRLDQRAMSIASASRSRRSVVNTMSAASEDAVRSRAPIATPTVAVAERRGVVDTVAHHHRHRAFRSARTAATCQPGSGRHTPRPIRARWPLPARARAVPGEHDQSVETG